jgi:glycosyltransferase involved in cell wall biosynthesis
VKVALIGTDLAPVRTGAGAIETLLAGWAAELGRLGHDAHVISRFPVTAEGGYQAHLAASTDDLARLIRHLQPDVSLLNNRPLWQRFVAGRTVHLFHNYPDAWAASDEATRAAIGTRTGDDIRICAVSSALRREVARVLEGSDAGVTPVSPFVADAYFSVPRQRSRGLILFPGRLMMKKGVLETLAASHELEGDGCRFRFLNYISPWTEPTEEHRHLQAAIRATPRCELLAPRRSPDEMARLYAQAHVVLCPSVRPEGLGLTALEAQACGVPVVSGALGGLAEAQLLPDLLVDPSDVVSFVAGIRRALSIPVAEQHALRAQVAARFTLKQSVASLMAVLE